MDVIASPPATPRPKKLPRMTREEFLDWVERQEEGYEFDGERPVPRNGEDGVTGGSRNHTLVVTALIAALYVRLRGTPFAVHHSEGPGVSPGSRSVRYPDVTVAPRGGRATDRVFEDAIVVFEVVSPSSGTNDRVVKLREYLRVPSLLRYVVLESAFGGCCVYSREPGGDAWTATSRTLGETLALPEVGVELPLDEIYEAADIPRDGEDAAARNPVATT